MQTVSDGLNNRETVDHKWLTFHVKPASHLILYNIINKHENMELVPSEPCVSSKDLFNMDMDRDSTRSPFSNICCLP
jgi:hypothetical protein